MAGKSANLYVRIEPEVKEEAEQILSSLGVSSSAAINMFYKQIIFCGGLPFDVKLPGPPSLDMTKWSKEQLDAEIEKGYQDMLAGRVEPADKVFEEIREEFGW
ncbi:MAG: type II toxin-antitoxin system RelB/DinJ family antitoxin [Oscillospiraceae bacterium]|nr:type II toxin-antitoxin system RelB/DinJ family antitoxin [Oscillospiraceae bacterium]MCD7805119.1 type II toxin-antitoxin system RelB/DinJ family antitoxin [Oscillospiraceae bacterium]MCD7889787.1 type II toxin-antitoxin system RelB/DinJ family antitoxin [Oscillospiraceae bacterium]